MQGPGFEPWTPPKKDVPIKQSDLIYQQKNCWYIQVNSFTIYEITNLYYYKD
jgi:hypothetical protein